MDIDALRRLCLQFPHVTENVQWGYDLVFKVDGKMFLVTPLEPAPVRMSFKAGPENFVELCERPGVRPAPYMARAQWVALEQLNTLPDSELRELIAESYRLVFEKLPKSRQQALQSLHENSGKKAPISQKPARSLNKPRSGGDDVSPGRKPRVKAKNLASRGAATASSQRRLQSGEASAAKKRSLAAKKKGPAPTGKKKSVKRGGRG